MTVGTPPTQFGHDESRVFIGSLALTLLPIAVGLIVLLIAGRNLSTTPSVSFDLYASAHPDVAAATGMPDGFAISVADFKARVMWILSITVMITLMLLLSAYSLAAVWAEGPHAVNLGRFTLRMPIGWRSAVLQLLVVCLLMLGFSIVDEHVHETLGWEILKKMSRGVLPVDWLMHALNVLAGVPLWLLVLANATLVARAEEVRDIHRFRRLWSMHTLLLAIAAATLVVIVLEVRAVFELAAVDIGLANPGTPELPDLVREYGMGMTGALGGIVSLFLAFAFVPSSLMFRRRHEALRLSLPEDDQKWLPRANLSSKLTSAFGIVAPFLAGFPLTEVLKLLEGGS